MREENNPHYNTWFNWLLEMIQKKDKLTDNQIKLLARANEDLFRGYYADKLTTAQAYKEYKSEPLTREIIL